MNGLYDWILNSLKVDESPAAFQLPAPTPAQANGGQALPTPFANQANGQQSGMPGAMNTLRQTMIQKYLQNLTSTPQQTAPTIPTAPTFVGNTPRQNQNVPMFFGRNPNMSTGGDY